MSEKRCNCIEINDVLSEKPTMDDIIKLSDFFKVMGDSTRLQILMALIQGEFCVSDLAGILNLSTSATSHQLKALKNAKLVKARREGKSMYYSLDDDHIKDILAESIVHVREC